MGGQGVCLGHGPQLNPEGGTRALPRADRAGKREREGVPGFPRFPEAAPSAAGAEIPPAPAPAAGRARPKRIKSQHADLQLLSSTCQQELILRLRLRRRSRPGRAGAGGRRWRHPSSTRCREELPPALASAAAARAKSRMLDP